jgi:hypothetical protein
VAALKHDGLSITYRFDDDSIHVAGTIAWMTYRNRGILSGDRGADTLHWIESAVLRREGNSWRMVLLHSTRVRQ